MVTVDSPAFREVTRRITGHVLTLQEDWSCIKQVVSPAGSLVIFTEALIHGTLPWQPDDRERRSVLFKYAPGYLAWGCAFDTCPISDPTVEEEALFEPPHRPNRRTLG